MSCGAKRAAFVNHRVDVRREIGLYRLGLVRTDEAKPHRCGAYAARRDEDECSLRVDESHVEHVEECAKQRRVVAGSRVASNMRADDAQSAPRETSVRRRSAARAPGRGSRGWRRGSTGTRRTTRRAARHPPGSGEPPSRAATRCGRTAPATASQTRARRRCRRHARAARRLEPAECANPPEGNAESISCHTRKFMSSISTAEPEILKTTPNLLISC